jgi:hypothetical protein
VTANDENEQRTEAHPDDSEPESSSRCWAQERGIVVLREVARGSAEQYTKLCERAFELGGEWERFALVLDLSDMASRPRGAYLQALRDSLLKPIHLAVVQPRSVMLRIVAGFLFGRMPRVSIHSSFEAALVSARAAVKEG